MIAFPTDSQTRPVVSFPERVPESSPGLTFDLRVHQDITYSTIFSGYYCVDERFVARDCLESLGSSLESLWNPADWMPNGRYGKDRSLILGSASEGGVSRATKRDNFRVAAVQELSRSIR